MQMPLRSGQQGRAGRGQLAHLRIKRFPLVLRIFAHCLKPGNLLVVVCVGPLQIVHKVLVGVAKSEDVPNLVRNDRFKVVALEASAPQHGVLLKCLSSQRWGNAGRGVQIDHIRPNHRSRDDHEQHELVV